MIKVLYNELVLPLSLCEEERTMYEATDGLPVVTLHLSMLPH